MPGAIGSGALALRTHPASWHGLLLADSLKWFLLDEAQLGPRH